MVRVFTTPACPYCITLKEFLKGKKVDFQEVDVFKDEKGREEMIEKTGQMGAPVIEINGEYIVGFNREKIMNLLGLKDN